MLSRILGTLPLAPADLAREAATIESCRFEVGYADYVFGRWSNCVLWNGSGNQDDAIIHEYAGAARPTPDAARLSLVGAILRDHFDVSHVRWARIFRMDEGVLLPHRDYVNMKAGYTRLHVPLQTHESCLHSEGDDVFHMRVGEVWFLDATNVHSACNLATKARLSLCIDFDASVPMGELVRARAPVARLPEPLMVARPALDEPAIDEILEAAGSVTEATFDATVAALARVHFRRRANAEAMFAWLDVATRRSGNSRLVERARALTTMALGEPRRVRAVA